MKKRIVNIIVSIALIAASLFSLIGCEGDDNTVKNGITVEPDAPYSEETRGKAKEVFLSLAEYVYNKYSPFEAPSDELQSRLSRYADGIVDITAKKPINEAKYLSMLEILKEKGRDAVDGFFAFRSGSSSELEKISSLYLDFTYIFGSENLSSMLFDLVLFVYDARYERTMEKFESFKFPWLEEEARALLRDKTVFAESVGKEEFSALIRSATAISELFSGSLDGISAAFSDGELLQMIKALDLDEINIEKEGWELLISYLIPEKTDADSSYKAELGYAVGVSGDVSKISEVMNDAVSLTVSVLERLTVDDVKAIREKDFEKLAASVFSRFSEKERTLFRRITEINLSNENYSALALAEYGGAYSEYLESLDEVSFDALFEALGTEEFYTALTEYLAGICPAVSYEVNK